MIECVKIYKVSDRIINFISKGIDNLKVELIVGEQILAEVKVQRGIIQRDLISPPLFIIATIPLNLYD